MLIVQANNCAGSPSKSLCWVFKQTSVFVVQAGGRY